MTLIAHRAKKRLSIRIAVNPAKMSGHASRCSGEPHNRLWKKTRWSTAILVLGAAALSWADSWNEGTAGIITAPSGTKVGIGIASPSAALDVNGSANISSNLGVAGTATFSTNIIKNSGYTSLNGDDNQATLFEVVQGSNSYIHVDNRNGAEAVSLGNTTTNPIVQFKGTGTKAFSGPVTMSSALGVSGLGTFANQIALSRANGSDIHNTYSSQSTAIWGGNIGQGGNFILYGPTHATLPNYWRLRHGTTVDMEFNGTNMAIRPAVYFSSNIIQNSGYTSLNGDDNQSTLFEVKQSTNSYIHVANTNGTESISLGNTTTHPSLNFLGSGTKAFSGPVTMASTLNLGADLTVGGGSGSVTMAVDGSVSGNQGYAWRSSGALRWRNRLASAESGSNSGGNLEWQAFQDNGTLIDVPMMIARTAGGVITMNRPVSISSDLIMPAGNALIRSNTSAGADNKRLVLAGGGADGSSRGAGITLAGNNHSNMPGYMDLVVGNVPGALLRFSAGGAIRASLSQAGNWNFDSQVDMHSMVKINSTLGVTEAITSNKYGGGSGAGIMVSSAAPAIGWRETDASADNQYWDFLANGSALSLRAVNDANSSSASAMTVARSGATISGINFPPPVTMSSSLEVAGDLTVGTVKARGWEISEAPDYVFEKEYPLVSLEKVESFVRKNKHLPEVPSARQMKEEGLDLVKMNFRLLKKVEELTLYAIKQNKEIEALKRSLEKIERSNRNVR